MGKSSRENFNTHHQKHFSSIQFSPSFKGSNLLEDAIHGNLPSMKKRLRHSFFKKPENINQRDERNCTPLHYASKNSHIEMIKFLLHKGADLAAFDKHGWSCLQYAVRYADFQTVDFLLQNKANVFHREKRGWNSLHLAAKNGQGDKARLLLEAGLDVHSKQIQGWNALHLSVRYGQPDTISLLLEYGIDIDAANSGWTALHLSALNGHSDIASILLNKGALTSIINGDGLTALQIARKENHDRLVAIILEAEFQSTLPPLLPSPPPSPKYDDDDDDDLRKLRNSLLSSREKVQENDYCTKSETETEEENENCTFRWKSLEDEERELSKQLEKAYLQEVHDLKNHLAQYKSQFSFQESKRQEQERYYISKIAELQNSIPKLRETTEEAVKGYQEKIVEIQLIIQEVSQESLIVNNLIYCRSIKTQKFPFSFKKEKAFEDWTQGHELEVFGLEGQIQIWKQKIESAYKICENKLKEIQESIKVYENKIKTNNERKNTLLKEQEIILENLQMELVKAEKESLIENRKSKEFFACPVCMTCLQPPLRIFQCPEGHILCEECKDNPTLVYCPQCRLHLEGALSRNRALEEVARSYFPSLESNVS